MKKHHLSTAVLCGVVSLGLAGCGDSKQAEAEAQKVAELQSRVEKLQTQVDLAHDISAIKKLQRTYGYYLDRGLADDMADLFTDSEPVAEYEVGAFLGKESIRNAFRYLGPNNSLPEGKMMTHMQLQGVVHVAPGGKTAQGRWRAFAMTANAGQARWQEGPYEVQYVKENDVWKIQNLRWYQTMTANYEGGWPKHKTAAPGSAPRPANAARTPVPDRPAKNKTWPDVVIPPYHYKNPVTGK